MSYNEVARIGKHYLLMDLDGGIDIHPHISHYLDIHLGNAVNKGEISTRIVLWSHGRMS
jgi:hypothetical protein